MKLWKGNVLHLSVSNSIHKVEEMLSLDGGAIFGGAILNNERKDDISVSHAGREYLLVDSYWVGVPYNTMMGRMISQYLMLYRNTCL